MSLSKNEILKFVKSVTGPTLDPQALKSQKRRKENALRYILGDTMVMADIAQAAYNAALRRAYRTNGVAQRRKVARGYQAQVRGLLAKLREGRKAV